MLFQGPWGREMGRRHERRVLTFVGHRLYRGASVRLDLGAAQILTCRITTAQHGEGNIRGLGAKQWIYWPV